MAQHLFIVHGSRAEIYESLRRALAGAADVEVVLDRRRSERRRRSEGAGRDGERRTHERRARHIADELASVGVAFVQTKRPERSGAGALAPSPVADDLVAFLRDTRLFKDFGLAELRTLARRLRERVLRRGQVLFREGDRGEEMFLVRRGTILISKAVTGRVDEVLARMQAGDFFGEMSPFGRRPRSATAQAETDASLLALDRETLLALIAMSPPGAVAFFNAMVQEFIERLRRTNDLLAEVTRWGLEATGLDLNTD